MHKIMLVNYVAMKCGWMTGQNISTGMCECLYYVSLDHWFVFHAILSFVYSAYISNLLVKLLSHCLCILYENVCNENLCIRKCMKHKQLSILYRYILYTNDNLNYTDLAGNILYGVV